ncbi:predicted protein [Pyrenophora tritici-repentis Pt-1C-BFP]|uniref:Uncharacterized protein n=1 Tax=Pyrenophora tritici-repentis (strain Pt-1C-BFP) TaxID=426418 RepID=B2W993_PYRTR|nr:uncharacterized protein PTRG_06551 [Pyrenophora tritici-repentis Pt-1C-BFP]EDU49471.1 predicted protein [Pyrenophora tritici-repentis Pt-1C-BFP]
MPPPKKQATLKQQPAPFVKWLAGGEVPLRLKEIPETATRGEGQQDINPQLYLPEDHMRIPMHHLSTTPDPTTPAHSKCYLRVPLLQPQEAMHIQAMQKNITLQKGREEDR